METNLIRISKFIGLVLRHNPGKIGLTLDENGWASVDELLVKAKIDFQIDLKLCFLLLSWELKKTIT